MLVYYHIIGLRCTGWLDARG